jgi:hypothetical protein
MVLIVIYKVVIETNLKVALQVVYAVVRQVVIMATS